MTGATSGFGKVAVCEIAKQGAKVFVFCRDDEKGKQLINHYHETCKDGKGSIETIHCDLSSLDSIPKACDELRTKTDKLDMIINNAGLMNFKFIETENHIEETLQVNLLAPILISHLLIDLLAKSSSAKLIFTASGLHSGVIHFDDIEFRNKFISYKSYAQSKLGIILLTRYLANKLAAKNIGVYCQHPGMVKTSLERNAPEFSKFIFNLMATTPEEGCKNLLYLVETFKDELVSGEYYDHFKVKQITKESYDMDMAENLFKAIKHYLNKYITKPSLIFDGNEKKLHFEPEIEGIFA